MSAAAEAGHAAPHWFTSPGEGDYLAVVVIVLVLAALYGIVWLYAAFDRWAEHRSKGTPLAKTIPTLLAIALLYEVFPLDHFHVLLPLSAVLVALLADLSSWRLGAWSKPEPQPAPPAPQAATARETDDV